MCCKILCFIKGFSPALSKIALDTACEDLHPHFVCRCLQIFRAIEISRLKNENVNSLAKLFLMHDRKSHKNYLRMRVTLEIIETYCVLIERENSETILKMPNIFWVGVSFLRSSMREEYIGGIRIINAYLLKLNVITHNDDKVKILEDSIPDSWKSGKWFKGLNILLLKGICSHKQEESSRLLMNSLMKLATSKIVDIESDRRYLVYILCFMPYLITNLGSQNCITTLIGLERELAKGNLQKLADLFATYKDKTTNGVRQFLSNLGEGIANVFFPKYEIFTFTVLITMLQNCHATYQKVILQIVESLIIHVDFSISPLANEYVCLFIPLLKHSEGNSWIAGLRVLHSLLTKSNPEADTTGVFNQNIKTMESMFVFSWDKDGEENDVKQALHGVLNIVPVTPPKKLELQPGPKSIPLSLPKPRDISPRKAPQKTPPAPPPRRTSANLQPSPLRLPSGSQSTNTTPKPPQRPPRPRRETSKFM